MTDEKSLDKAGELGGGEFAGAKPAGGSWGGSKSTSEKSTASKTTSSQLKSTKSIAALMVALLVAIFAFQLNSSMLTPALVQMETELNASTVEIGNTQAVFFAACALFSLFLPRLADHLGRRRVLSGMLAITAIGCVVSAMAPNVDLLLIGRVMQGVAGPVVPMCLIMLRQKVSADKQYAKLMAILTSVNGGIAGVDALLGGWLANEFGFRSVFITMAIVAAVGVVLILIFAEESKSEEAVHIDVAGMVTLGIAFLATYLVINELQQAEMGPVFVAVLVVVAVVFFAIFWNIEKRKADPMVQVKYIKQRRTWALLTTTLLTMMGVFAIMNGVVPAIAQDDLMGINLGTEVVSFATLTPYAIVGLIFGPVAGVLASKHGYRAVLRGGLIVSLAGVVFGIILVANPSIPAIVAISVVLGFSYAGCANIMLNGLGIVLSPKDNTGYLPGMNAGAFNLGAGLSYALLYSVMNALTASGGASCGPAAGYSGAFIAGAIVLCAAFAVSILIPKPEDCE